MSLIVAGCAGGSAPPDAHATNAPTTQQSALHAPPPTPAPPTPRTASAPDPMTRVVAEIDGQNISLQQLLGPLIESRGLTILINVVQLQLAKEDAAKAGITLSEADFQAERDMTLSKMFKDADDKVQDQLDRAQQHNDAAEAARIRQDLRHEHEQLLDQFLQQRNITRAEFDLILQINAYLRKIVEPAVNRSITEASLRAAFNQLYGETVQVRHIQLANQAEVADAQRRLARGDKFEEVARALSHNRLSGELGGELPRFSREAPGYPPSFKDVAFSLQPGQVSDPVEANGSFHLIKMDARFAPRAVKFETVREAVRQQLFEAAEQTAVKKLRDDLSQRVLAGLKIEDPILRRQFNDRIKVGEEKARERDTIRQDMDRERRQHLTAPPASAAPAPAAPRDSAATPATQTAQHPATQPATGP